MEKYPLSMKAAKNWYLKLIIENLKNQSMTDEEIQQVQNMGLVNDDISGILESNPIALCKFFDKQDICIGIDLNMNKTFSYKILASEGMLVDGKEYTRDEAEKEAIITAFKFLETVLKTQENGGQDSSASSESLPEQE